MRNIKDIFERCDMKMLMNLFFSFFKVGLFTFGGGAAMLPLLQAEFVERKKWVVEKELIDFYSIGQCTPGIIAINTATFIGYKMMGIKGAVAATMGMIFPSIIIILSIAAILNECMSNKYVTYAFAGVRIVVVALILDAVCRLWKNGISDWFAYAMFIGSLLLLFLFTCSPVTLILIAGICGYVFAWSQRRIIK